MYVRVSTGGQSVETQNDAVVRAARARGDVIGRVYAEIEGGGARRRPELERLLEDVRAGLIGRLYVYRLDRLSRAGIRSMLALVEELEAETGIPIYDTIATVVWKSLKLAGADPRRIAGWGRLFREVG